MSETPKSICVFAGSSFGRKPIYREAAEALGQAIGSRGLTLVYGGARIGLMGTVANAVLAEDGQVHGVLPRHLADLEIAHQGLTQLELVDSMHARKARMNELADAFIALPGGIGTLEEAIEIWTWGQLQLHAKPLGLLNVDGFYDQLSGFLDHVTAERFLTEAYRATLISQPSPETLIDLILTAEIPVGQKWIDDLQD